MGLCRSWGGRCGEQPLKPACPESTEVLGTQRGEAGNVSCQFSVVSSRLPWEGTTRSLRFGRDDRFFGLGPGARSER
jgi:hypothetical protein